MNPAADFSNAGTFNFFDPLDTDRSGARTPLSIFLMASLTREMEKRGFQKSNSPDLLLNTFVNIEERMDVRTTPTSTSFHSYRMRRYRPWPGYTTTVRRYEVGTLAIDIVVASTNILAWEGVAQGRLRETSFTQDQIDAVVGQVMEQFTFSAAR